MRQLYKLVFILLLANLAVLQPLCSQTFTDAGITLTGVSSSSIAWGDFDNDGNLDILLVGSTAGSTNVAKIYKNNGDGTFTAQSTIILSEVYSCSVAWGDYNNDGYLDILITGEGDLGLISKIYKNNGDKTFTEQTTITLTGVGLSSAAWGDYDNDGYLDILITGATTAGGIAKIYRNNGDGTFAEQTGIKLKAVRSCSAAWGDYDNDGYMDLLMTGSDVTSLLPLSIIYRNNGDNTFTEQTSIGLTNVNFSSAVWGDYDNDGYLDILLTGKTVTNPVSKIYHNNGNGTFTEQTSISLTGVYYSSVAWGDYDNDGYLDILLTGTISPSVRTSKIYHNNHHGNFTELSGLSLTNVDGSSVAWGDYDNDGDLDILLTGDMGAGYVSKIYKNSTIIATPKNGNNAPAAPANITIKANQGGNVTFAWDKATDTETPQKGLSYNLYVYPEAGTNYLRSPQAFNQTNVKNGRRLIASIGNIQDTTTGYTLLNLPSGNYKWSVQAVDGGLNGGPFAVEQTINVVNLNKVGVNVAGGKLIFTSPDIEYSINSTTGSNGTWAPCASQSTNVNYGTGGFDVWVREKSTPSNYHKVATIAAQITPAFTIDYFNEKTTQAIADSVEYSTSADMSGAISGTVIKLTVIPGQSWYFRVKATAGKVISAIQTLTAPNRRTPTYTINYSAETTNEAVPSIDKYSVNANMSAATAGTGIKITLTPGQNLYFRSGATTSSFQSLIQTLVIPSRPVNTAYTFGFISETTNESIATSDEYSVNSDMSAAISGTGEKISVTPGQNLYLRTKATTTGFASLVQTLVIDFRPTAPVNSYVSDASNTFDWTSNSLFPDIASYEYSLDNGSNWQTCTVKPVIVGNIDLAAGFLQVRVKATTSNFKGTALVSNAAYTKSIVGIDELQAIGIQCYPNPVKDILIVKNIPGSSDLTIWSMEGQLIKSIHMENTPDQINVSDLPVGVYILKIKNCKINAEARFVKE